MTMTKTNEKRKAMRTLHAVPQHRNGDCDPHEAQIDIPVNLPRTSFALPLTTPPPHRGIEGVFLAEVPPLIP